MKLNILGAAAMALCLATAPVAFAQSGSDTSGTSGNASGNSNQPTVKTDMGETKSTTGGMNEGWTQADTSFFEEHDRLFNGFFTDESRSTMRTEAEVKAAFAGMSTEDQAGVKDACGRVALDRGSYSPATQGLCAQVGI
jgi:hypothetical protein